MDVMESHQYLGDKHNFGHGTFQNYFKFQINTNKYWELLILKDIVVHFLVLCVLEGQKLSMKSMNFTGEEAIRTAT